MLKISSRGRYGVKAVFELALRYGQGPVTVTMIAKAQGISEQYLEQLMVPLKRAGIVDGLRGAQGGYRLSRSPREISVGDVVGAVEGPIALADCSTGALTDCAEMGYCVGPDIWNRVQAALIATMDSICFQTLVEEQRQRLETWAEVGG